MSAVRVVGSLTTMHDRYPKLVRTLQGLNNQTYPLSAIYLGLPFKSLRLGVEYPEPTEEMESLCTVVRCPDYGPITKLAGALLSEQDPNTVIITFDDDMAYPPNVVEELVKKHLQYPNSVLGSSGMLLKYACPMCAITPNENNAIYRVSKFSIPPEGRRVDSVYGYPGALYVRKFFPRKEELEDKFFKYALVDQDMLMNDDIVISGYISLQNIERRIFDNMPEVGFTLLDGQTHRVQKDNEISYNLDKFFQRMNGAIAKSKDFGMFAEPEPMDFSETIFGISSLIILVAIALIALFIYCICS